MAIGALIFRKLVCQGFAICCGKGLAVHGYSLFGGVRNGILTIKKSAAETSWPHLPETETLLISDARTLGVG
jgi:hypothetical protein